MAYGTVYEVPDDIGQFDVGIFGSILLHLRDPFLALQRALAHVNETVVVTDVAPHLTENRLPAGGRVIEFLPNAHDCRPIDTWWNLSPELVSEFLRILRSAVLTLPRLQRPVRGSFGSRRCAGVDGGAVGALDRLCDQLVP